MKHIKLYEQFGVMNEAEKQLSGGYVNSHTATTKDQSPEIVKGKTFFLTNLTNPSEGYGVPGQLEVVKNDGRSMLQLLFPSSSYDPQEIVSSDKELKMGAQAKKMVLAKTAQEAKANALNILLAANLIANGSYEAKGVANLVKAFFEIQKMYPEYMTKNPMFGAFIQGLTTAWVNPKIGPELGINDYTGEFKKMLGEEVKKALVDVGVIK